ncbi:tyrosine-type recombinase/integrase [Methylorubrum extorquens]|uniref:Integrase family protein n=1 Tax=Methylorubrum extorquens (strain CM4 / NCIMB 13688) TaxID=440085 RepID=B7KTU8_METC4|nr:tyrosine-type recombinase/integrase [Methylorubrum extorquens]ACK84158.1 integrase family protein [Methylorubrum extorquens CM4]
MATIRKRTLPSGRTCWLAAYVDSGGKRRFRQFSTKREADAFLVQARSQVGQGVHTPDSLSPTVAEAAEIWLKRCERDRLEPTTIEQYRGHVTLHIAPHIGAVKLSRLTAPLVNEFAEKLLTGGRSRELCRRVLISLSSIVTEAQRRGLVTVNNVRSAKPVKRSGREDTRPVMPTKAELRAIIRATPDRSRPMILTLLFAGLRGSEMRGLLWEDVDLKCGVLHVRRRADRFNSFGPPKSKAGIRDIPLPPTLLQDLKAWRLACPNGPLGLVFPTTAGTVQGHANILHRVFWPLQIAAGVTVPGPDGRLKAKYGLHALRHAAAALWIEQGLNSKRIQTLMGHASIQQTMDRYGYLFEAREDETAMLAGLESGLLN